MGKSMEKRRSYNTLVISELAKRYKCTDRFVRLSLRGERSSERAELIQKDYKELTQKVESALSE